MTCYRQQSVEATYLHLLLGLLVGLGGLLACTTHSRLHVANLQRARAQVRRPGLTGHERQANMGGGWHKAPCDVWTCQALMHHPALTACWAPVWAPRVASWAACLPAS